MKFHYVYRLVSLSHPGRRYVGFTNDLKTRLAKHKLNSTVNCYLLFPTDPTSATNMLRTLSSSVIAS
jgi:hypothetical protein